jgi:uncharacterized protein
VDDPYAITTLEEVIACVGEPKPSTQAKVVRDLGPTERRFIEGCPFVVVATASAEGVVTASPKGDAPGFVRVKDDRTLIVPERPGNRLVMGYRNLLENPRIGLLFITPPSVDTLRVEGRATLTRDPRLLGALAARGRDAQLAIRVQIERCYFHCGKAFLRSKLWEPASWSEAFDFTWGAWAAERYGVGVSQAQAIDEEIAEDYEHNL